MTTMTTQYERYNRRKFILNGVQTKSQPRRYGYTYISDNIQLRHSTIIVGYM